MIATCFALVGFAAAIAVGIASSIEATAVLWRATATMIVCFIVGSIVGKVAQHTIDLHIQRHQQLNPIPDGEPSALTENADGNTGNTITSTAAQATSPADAV